MTEISYKDDFKSFKDEINKERKRLFLKRFLSNKMAITGLVVLLIMILFSMFGSLFSNYGPLEMNQVDRLQPPSSEYYFGTDTFGRDLFSRVVNGTQGSLLVGLLVTITSTVIGTIVGLYASYYRVLDHLLMRICDGLMAFPAVLLALALVAALGPKISNVIIALTIVYFPNVARIIRSSALVVREQTYIEAMRANGASSFRIIWGHIFPNTLSPLIVQATFIFAVAIIIEAMLSFLGAGIPAPFPSLGNILYEAKNVLTVGWWMTLFPGFMLIMLVLSLNLFGDGLRDILDPHKNQ